MRKPILMLAAALGLSGQQAPGRYAPLMQALCLTDIRATATLNADRQLKLAEIGKVLVRFETSAAAVAMGLISVHDWPTGWPCPRGPIGLYEREFDLTAEQITQLAKLQQDAWQPILELQWAKQKRHRELLDSGESESSPEVAALMTELDRLQKQYAETRPPRDLARAVLNDAQKQKLAAFESDLELAREALELHLIQLPGLPEILCH